jgi:hypothetical protein
MVVNKDITKEIESLKKEKNAINPCTLLSDF